MKERNTKATPECVKDALIGELTEVVRADGDMKLDIEGFFGRVERSIARNGSHSTSRNYDLPLELVEKIEIYMEKQNA